MKRVIIGQRGTAYGIWASPPGVDVLTAPDSSLSLLMGNNYAQIGLIGVATAGQVITHGFTTAPHVLLLGNISGATIRPYPSPAGYPNSGPTTYGTNGYAAVGATTFTISYASSYAVFKRAF